MVRKSSKKKDPLDETPPGSKPPALKPLVHFEWAGKGQNENQLAAELARFLIDNRKDAIGESVWNGLSEATQRAHINEASEIAGAVVRNCFEIFAQHVFMGISATVEQITIKDGAKVTLTVDKHDDLIQQLIARVGGRSYIALANAALFGSSSNHGVAAEPEQRTLPVDDPPPNDGNQPPAPPDHVEIEPPLAEVTQQGNEGAGSQPEPDTSTLPEVPPPAEVQPNKYGNRTIRYAEDEL